MRATEARCETGELVHTSPPEMIDRVFEDRAGGACGDGNLQEKRGPVCLGPLETIMLAIATADVLFGPRSKQRALRVLLHRTQTFTVAGSRCDPRCYVRVIKRSRRPRNRKY